MQTRNQNNILGIDVSRHQGEIDWMKVSGVQFAYVKASEGVGYIDPLFRRNAVGAPAVGLKVGFYHYCRPETGNSPQAEAESFLNAIGNLPSDLPHVLDVEGEAADLGNKLTDWCCEWLEAVQKRSNHRVMVYTGASFAKSYLGAKLAKYPLWVAHYNTQQPLSNNTWDRWAIFQFTSSGTVPGINGNVDMNEMDLSFWKGATMLERAFNDVPEGHWAEKAINVVNKAGIMTGYEDGTFKLDKPVTRAELAKVVNDLLYIISETR